jgi:hypothetical protein
VAFACQDQRSQKRNPTHVVVLTIVWSFSKEILFIVTHTVAAFCVNTNGFLKEKTTHAAATTTITTLFS